MTSAANDVDYVIDLRGVQSHMPERGIPRYLLNLSDALVLRADVSGLWAIVDPIRPLPPLSPSFGLRAGMGSVDDEPAGMPASGARTLVHHIGSPFELYLRRPDLEPFWLRERAPITAVSLFDVIPAIQPETFPPWARRLWGARVELLRSADVVLCISQYTADDGIRHLDLDESRVAVVGTGVPPPTGGHADLPLSLPSVRRPFVLYTGGSDHPRKNIPALVRSFARVTPAVRDGIQLVIATRISDEVRRALITEARRAGVADALVVTGFVSDADLAALYRSCVCMVYPSLYEGFGLPIVEAMSYGAPVIASSTTSCGEIQEHPSARFDPTDEAHMTAVLERALASVPLRDELRAYGLQRARDFTWAAVAERTLAACRAAAPRDRNRRARRSRVCLFVAEGVSEPLSPQAAFVAIAGCAQALDPRVQVIADGDRPAARGAPLLVSALDATPVCLICNAASARIAADALARAPGIAVIWELDALLAAPEGVQSPPVAHPYLLAALHHARHVVVASQLDAWRVTLAGGRALGGTPVVAAMPLPLARDATAVVATPPALALLRPERLGALGAPELTRLAHFAAQLGLHGCALPLEIVACLGASADGLLTAADDAGVALSIRHPDAHSLSQSALSAAIHLHVAGASHSASLFSDAVARAVARPLVAVGDGLSAAPLELIASAGASGGSAFWGPVEARHRLLVAGMAQKLLELGRDIDARWQASTPQPAASLTA